MACINCLENCGGKITSDQCVEYTGDPIPLLGICTGDQLSSVEAAIINGLLTALDGTGISVSSVTLENCAWLQQQFVGVNPTLANFLQLFVNSTCSLYAMIQALQAQSGGTATYTTSCLSGLPTNPTPNQVLSALTADYCALKAVVTAFPSTYVANSDLQLQVTQILQSLGVIGGGTTTYNQYIPIGAILPYYGSLANFDNSGKGLAAAGLTGFYFCNGLNGAPDFRGRSLVGAVRNVPGGSLDTAVDPTQIFNPNTNYAIGDKFGENNHTLLTSEIPSHSHGINDPGHSHTSVIYLDVKGGSAGTPVLSSANNSRGTTNVQTNSAVTGITVNSAGSNAFHNNVQPSVAVYWIIRLQ